MRQSWLELRLLLDVKSSASSSSSKRRRKKKAPKTSSSRSPWRADTAMWALFPVLMCQSPRQRGGFTGSCCDSGGSCFTYCDSGGSCSTCRVELDFTEFNGHLFLASCGTLPVVGATTMVQLSLAPSVLTCTAMRSGPCAIPSLSLQRRWFLRCLGSMCRT